jgi:hypothetical protein
MTASQHTVNKTIRSRRLALPLVETNPLFDIKWLILLLPVWWWLGIEQFVWPIVLGIALIRMIFIQQFRLIITPPLKWYAFYLSIILVSSFFIVEGYRWLTYVRNLGAYLSGFFVLLILSNRIKNERSLNQILNAMLIAVIIVGFIGLLGVIGIWRPVIESMVGQFLPDSIANTSYGKTIIIRSIGTRGWFVGLGEYFRLTGLFLFANHYATVIVYTLPILFFKSNQSRSWRKILINLAIIMMVVNLIYTTSRVALLAVVGGGVYFVSFHSFYRRKIRIFIALVLTITILVLLLSTFIDLASPYEPGFLNLIEESIQSFVFARGEGSFTGRSAVYQASFEGFRQRPFFGWGTERDVPGLTYPAGSHSEYIAVMYRQGLVGIIAFLGLIISTWRMTQPPKGPAARTPEGSFLRYGRWVFVAALINSIATDPAIDTTVYFIFWLIISLLIAAALLLRRNSNHVTAQH